MPPQIGVCPGELEGDDQVSAALKNLVLGSKSLTFVILHPFPKSVFQDVSVLLLANGKSVYLTQMLLIASKYTC